MRTGRRRVGGGGDRERSPVASLAAANNFQVWGTVWGHRVDGGGGRERSLVANLAAAKNFPDFLLTAIRLANGHKAHLHVRTPLYLSIHTFVGNVCVDIPCGKRLLSTGLSGLGTADNPQHTVFHTFPTLVSYFLPHLDLLVQGMNARKARVVYRTTPFPYCPRFPLSPTQPPHFHSHFHPHRTPT